MSNGANKIRAPPAVTRGAPLACELSRSHRREPTCSCAIARCVSVGPRMGDSELYLSAAKDRLGEQNERLAGFHSRVAATMTVSIALAGVTGLLLRDYQGSAQAVLFPALLFAVTFIVTQVLSISVLKPGENWRLGPDLDTYQEHLAADWDLVKWVADSTVIDVTSNECILRDKGRALIFGYWALSFLALLTVAIGFLATLMPLSP